MIHVKMTIMKHPTKMAKEFRNFTKEGLIDLVVDWHRNTMPKHFEPIAVNAYNYKPRTKGYMIRKARYRHHQRPLAFSGESEKELRRMIRVSGNSRRARGKFNAPRHFWMTPVNHPLKAEELYAVNKNEASDMAQRLNESVTKKLNNISEKQVFE